MSNVASLEKAAEKLAKKRPAPPRKYQAGRFDSTGRRVIRLDAGFLPEILDEMGESLAKTECNLFTYARRLVRLYHAQASTSQGLSRPKGTPILHPVDGAHLTELAGRGALFERYDARSEGYRPCDCPRRYADAYLARGNYPEMRPLEGFSEAPIITLSGRLIDTPGYDPETGLFLAFETIPGYTAPPEKPSKDDAYGAAIRLLDMVSGFPFVDESDRTAFLAGVITGFLRRLLPAAPMIAITAPAAGTGKSLIAETFSIITTGRRASVIALGHDDAETEKRLGGAFLAGHQFIIFDNLERPMRGEFFCQVLTQTSVDIRPLGGSGMISVPTHALLVATGNNLSIQGDLKRRVALIRMDAKQERPEQRTFKRDHLHYVSAHRGEFIRDALTICLAYLYAGAPAIAGLYPMGGFEQWDRMVRRPLVWIGLADPLRASEGLRENDPDIEAMRLMFSAWQQSFSDRPVTVAEVVTEGASVGQSANDELRDVLQIVCREKPSSQRLGCWLRAHRDRIVDGKTLRQGKADGHAKVARWCVIGTAVSAGDDVPPVVPF